MIRTAEANESSLCDNCEVWIGGAFVSGDLNRVQFANAISQRAPLCDLQHEAGGADVLTCSQCGEGFAIREELPMYQAGGWAKQKASDAILKKAGAIAFRVGGDIFGDIWLLRDAKDQPKDIDPQFADNFDRQVQRATPDALLLVTDSTDPKSDSASTASEQSPAKELRVVRETDAGIIVRGAEFQTAAAYANLTNILAACTPTCADSAVSKWFSMEKPHPRSVLVSPD